VRGSLAHRVLETVVAQLAAADGGIAASTAEGREQLAAQVLADEGAKRPLSVNPERLSAELRRLELDLISYLDRAANSGSSFTPQHFEFAFGEAEEHHPPLELGGGLVRIAGRIDRIDISADGARAVVYDYKGRAEPVPHARWIDEGRLQVLLYLLAVRDLMNLDAVGGFYQPLNAEGHAARGVLLEEEDERLQTTKGDRVDADALEALLAQAADRAITAVEEIRSGALEPRPDTCGWKAGCQYPTICRSAAVSG
jgi:ATP-dependent helicase/DNAse subunit B